MGVKTELTKIRAQNIKTTVLEIILSHAHTKN